MNRFDFSQIGGFPLTQDRLDYMQDSYLTALNLLAGLAGDTMPCAMTGVELTAGNWQTGGTVSDGWVYHPTFGLMPFIGGAFTPATQGVLYTQSATGLTFGNNTVQNVQLRLYATMMAGSGNDLMNLSTTRWHGQFGKSARTGWMNVPLDDFAVLYLSGSVAYAIDNLANVAHVKGTVTRTMPAAPASAVSGTELAPLVYLPFDAKPAEQVPFRSNFNISFNEQKDWQGNIFTGDDGLIELEPPLGRPLLMLRWRSLQTAGNYTLDFQFAYPLY